MFWDRFYALCIKKETKPNTIAREIGVSNAICTKWKKTGVIPNGETLEKIADCLDCSVDYLLGRTDNPESNKKSVSEFVANPETLKFMKLFEQLDNSKKDLIINTMTEFLEK